MSDANTEKGARRTLWSSRPKRRRVLGVAAVLSATAVLMVGCSQAQKPKPTVGGHAKIAYGPFKIPDVNTAGASGEKGMLTTGVLGAKMPCNDCYITGIRAGLEYTDGTNANIDSGVWLHHMVAMASGTGKSSATCAGEPERFFASGNERTPFEASRMGNYGYRVNAGDNWIFMVELMNLNTTAKTVRMTLDYDYVPVSNPGIKPIRPVWLDITGCGNSEKDPLSNTAPYSFDNHWKSTVTGQIVSVASHLHDGGTSLVVTANGALVCDTHAAYGGNPAYVEPDGTDMDHGSGSEHSHGGAEHISSMPMCYNKEKPLPRISQGTDLEIKANYDPTLHPQMVHDGKLHPVMGIAIVWVGV